MADVTVKDIFKEIASTLPVRPVLFFDFLRAAMMEFDSINSMTAALITAEPSAAKRAEAK